MEDPLKPRNTAFLLEQMNQGEARYASHLELLLKVPQSEMLAWRFQPLTFILADHTRYTPDFLCVYADRFEVHEFKGFWRDDARVKIKVAASQYPWFRWYAIQEKRKRDGGGYSIEEIKSRPLDLTGLGVII